MNYYIFLIAIVVIACLLCNKISNKFGVPTLLAFILLGMFFGSDGVVKISFDNFGFAEKICSFALIFIMFYGGFGTKWSMAKQVMGRAVLLSTIGVVLTAGFTGLFCHFVLHIRPLESFLIGALISSTDAASVFSILRSKRLNLKYRTASLLEVESGSNDPCSYMLTTIMLVLMESGNINAKNVLYLIFAQVAFGVVFGVIAAYFTIFALRHFSFVTEGFDTIFVFAAVLMSYVVPSMLGGNGYLSAYLFGIILGNTNLKNKKTYVSFFDGVTGLMQMLVFFLLGLLSFPSSLPQVMGPALLVALFLTFVARPLVVFLLLTPFKCVWQQQILISAAGLRGAASIVFAIVAMTNPAYQGRDVFHMVFFIVLFSILVQGTLLPFIAKKLDMIDEKEDVLKTFTDYTDEVPVQFIQFTITKKHRWDGCMVKDIVLPPETLLVELQRGGERITPDGSTVLLEGDIGILSAKAPGRQDDVSLTEVMLESGNDWIGKKVYELNLEPGKLVVMVQRQDDIVIPNGKTILQEEDVLVMREA